MQEQAACQQLDILLALLDRSDWYQRCAAVCSPIMSWQHGVKRRHISLLGKLSQSGIDEVGHDPWLAGAKQYGNMLTVTTCCQ